MSGVDSWEDDAQDEGLAQRTQQNLNLNNRQQPGVFQPGAAQFQPGAQSFQPQYQQNQQYPQQGYGGYPQYAQQGYGGQGYGYNQGYSQGGYGQHNGYGNVYGQQQQQPQQQQYGGYNQQQNFQRQQPQQQRTSQQPQQQQQQPRQTPIIAKRPQPGQTAPPPVQQPASSASETTKPKVLSIGGDAAPKKAEPTPKVESQGATKVLSLGTPASEKPAEKTTAKDLDPEKVTAAKAMEKQAEPSAATAGKTESAPASGKSSPTPAEKRQAAREADAVAKEQAADVDDATLQEMYGKEHVNVIFLGHVDAGKSTLGGSILYATGMVDERTMDKYKREAKDAGTESWYISWALDLTKEERSKGKTVEVGRGFFETEKRRYSILDAPGHKTFVPNMIGGASQADVGVLVISARKGEYETGFEKGGQTREHAMLAKTQGVNKLIVAINKMDDPTVEWSHDRYEECQKKLLVFLKGVGYNPKTDIHIMPVSGQQSLGIKDRVPKDLCPWYDGPSLLEYLDSMQALERKINAPFMMPVAAKYRDLGTMIEGKIESGVVKKGNKYLMMPNREQVDISALYGETEDEVENAVSGEQVRIRLRGIEEEDILPGFVLCSPKRPVHCVSAFEAQVVLLDIKSILSAGFDCVMHVHSATEEVRFEELLHKLEKGTNRRSKKPPPFAKKGMSIIARLRIIGGAGNVCVERFEDYPQLGRFTLRDQGQSIAIGKITKLITEPTA